jgi:hypothetical protein
MIEQVPVGVWVAAGVCGYVAGGSAVTSYWMERKWFLKDDPMPVFVFLLWPLVLVGTVGSIYGRWLASPPAPRPIPLPDEIKEKRS